MTRRTTSLGMALGVATWGLLFPFLPLPASGQAILNVERLQGDEVDGIHGEFSARLRLDEGNTDLLQVGGDLGLGYLTERHWGRIYLGGERLKRQGTDILDNRYLHLRYNFRFTDRLRTFHFFQLQSNENLLIDRRRLLGSGLRIRVFGDAAARLEVGSGLMWEEEELNTAQLEPGEEEETRTWRFSNLVVGSGPLGEGNRWVTVVYYQPNASDFGDSRLSGELGVRAGLVAGLALDVTLTWRHDNRAPARLERNDLGLRTGFNYRIQ